MTSGTSWSVVLPLKGGNGAKSRLGGPPELARAIALDCLDAVLAAATVHRVLVVTPDAVMAAEAALLGAEVLPEPPPDHPPRRPAGLLGAVSLGLASSTGPTAVLLGDLPALHPEDLETALEAVLEACTETSAAFVPDADGAGTVLLAGRRPGGLAPRFGTGSAAAHAATGAVRLELDLPRLRRDVDTPSDLAAARELGLGPRTAAVLG